MADQERQEDKALRDEIAQSIDYALFYEIELPAELGLDGPQVQRIATLLADAVLPVVQAHERALRDQIEDERNAHARAELLADGDREAARDELAELRSAVAHLADELDGDAEHYERIVADHNRSLWIRDEAGARAMAKRDSARRLRSLLPQEGPDREGAER